MPSVRSDLDLAAVVGQSETEELEFKGDTWADGEECAKDVAALGNAWGGQILVGVTEVGGTSRADGFRDWLGAQTEAAAQQQVQQWLEHSLRPRDFVDRISYCGFRELRTGHSGSSEPPPGGPPRAGARLRPLARSASPGPQLVRHVARAIRRSA
jgi:hypothetical protein